MKTVWLHGLNKAQTSLVLSGRRVESSRVHFPLFSNFLQSEFSFTALFAFGKYSQEDFIIGYGVPFEDPESGHLNGRIDQLLFKLSFGLVRPLPLLRLPDLRDVAFQNGLSITPAHCPFHGLKCGFRCCIAG